MALQRTYRNGPRTTGRHIGALVEDQDLWFCLLGEIERADDYAICVKFWHTPKEWNLMVHRFTKEAAGGDGGCDGFRDTINIRD